MELKVCQKEPKFSSSHLLERAEMMYQLGTPGLYMVLWSSPGGGKKIGDLLLAAIAAGNNLHETSDRLVVPS